MEANVWSDFWPQVLGNVLSLVIGGLLFTVLWGAFTSRRQALHRQVDRVTPWFDDLGMAATDQIQRMRNVVNLQNTLPKPLPDLDAGEAGRIAADLDEGARRIFNTMTRVGQLTVLARTFDDVRITEVVNRFIAGIADAQEIFARMNPFEERAADDLRQIEEILRQALPMGTEALSLMVEAASFCKILSYHRRLLERLESS